MSELPSLAAIKIFADGASLPSMLESARDRRIAGFTTNPTLMRKAGVTDYRAFARQVLAEIKDRPISFEVFADDTANMRRQAKEIATWGDNVNVKLAVIPGLSRGASLGSTWKWSSIGSFRSSVAIT